MTLADEAKFKAISANGSEVFSDLNFGVFMF
jgi:hypothetical protein